MKRMLVLAVLLVVVAPVLTGCSGLAFGPEPTPTSTPTPYPTFTPYPTLTAYPTFTPYPTLTAAPTYTPYPTHTPPPPTPTTAPAGSAGVGDPLIGAHWAITVTEAVASREFGTWSINEDSDHVLVLVTVAYQSLVDEKVVFYPESVVLISTGGGGYEGWVKSPDLYQSAVSSQITDFDTSYMTEYVYPGAPRSATFAYEFPPGYTEFLLLFPEMPAVRIAVK